MIPMVTPGLWDYSHNKRFKSYPGVAVVRFLGFESLVELPVHRDENGKIDYSPEIHVLFSLNGVLFSPNGPQHCIEVLCQLQGFDRGTPVYEVVPEFSKKIFQCISKTRENSSRSNHHPL